MFPEQQNDMFEDFCDMWFTLNLLCYLYKNL
jgi:hypothetical protein